MHMENTPKTTQSAGQGASREKTGGNRNSRPHGGQGGAHGQTRPPFRGGARGGRGGPGKEGERGRRGGGSQRRERIRPEFEQRVVNIRRVTRVVAGGRRFNFSVVMILGDKKGTVGVGIGKAGDTALAIEKAIKDAKKNMIKVPLTKTMSIPHSVSAKYCSSLVVISPAPGGGRVAGSSVRNVLELAGVTDVMSKIHSRSRNRLNNARVAIEALKKLKRTAVLAPAPALPQTEPVSVPAPLVAE